MPLQLLDLLEKGYFPKELPPPFHTKSYATALAGPGVVPPGAAFTGIPQYSQQYVHNLVRASGLRRNLGIPNPIHFYRLANLVVTHWPALVGLATASPFSLTIPIDGKPDRAISPTHDLNERTLFRAKIRAPARFILKADISRFFPSIYTHSIPWAILGKGPAKAAHIARALAGTWPDLLDVQSRSINNNQTIGLPIGPDTSRLLAEVVLARIDTELQARIPDLVGIRFIDDYEFSFASRADAEKTLGHLQHLLNEYELALNPNKTEIRELPDVFDPPWISKLRSFVFRKAGIRGQRNDLTTYFDMAYSLIKEFPDEGLLKYAVARLRDQDINAANWVFFENILSHCALVEPASLPQICDQLVFYRLRGHFLNLPLWHDCLNRIVSERVPLGQSSEATWAMWILKIFRANLTPTSESVISATEDSAVGLMGLGMASVGLANPGALTGLHRFGHPDELFQGRWLLCYQGNYEGWLGPTSGRPVLRSNPGMALLEARNVSFFDIGALPTAPIRHGFVLGIGAGGGY